MVGAARFSTSNGILLPSVDRMASEAPYSRVLQHQSTDMDVTDV